MARQAICVRYLNPTNHLGPRVKAYCNAGRVIVPWDHEASDEDNFWMVATTLIVKLKWNTVTDAYGKWVMGWLPKGFRDSAVFVLDDRRV